MSLEKNLKPTIAFQTLSEIAFGGKSKSGFELDEVVPQIEQYVEMLEDRIEELEKPILFRKLRNQQN